MSNSTDFARVQQECRSLLALPDGALTPDAMLRLDIMATLRLAFGGEQAKLLGGRSSDPAKLMQVSDMLLKLMPPPSPAEMSKDEGYKNLTDAELGALTILVAATDGNPAYVGGRARLASLIGNNHDFSDAVAAQAERAKELATLRAELAALRAENIALRQQAATSEPVRTAQIVELLPPPPRQLPPPEPEQAVGTTAAAANQQNWRPPGHWKKQSEPWDNYLAAPGSSLRKPCGAITPNSARCARRAFTSAVRWRTSLSRPRCSNSAACCSAVFVGTKRIVGRETASQIVGKLIGIVRNEEDARLPAAARQVLQVASASAASFLLRLMYAFTYCAGISLTSSPSAPNSRAQ
jgi:hypothetical protein